MKSPKPMDRIAVLTSGGDAPGMNAAIRAVVRTAHYEGIQPIGILRGYRGLLSNEFIPLEPRSVSNIIQKGGTMLKTSRCKEFKTREGIKKAAEHLNQNKIDGLITIGGDGTYRGAYDLLKVWHGKVVGVPGTIDNDLYGTEYTIGFNTAVNTALDAIDKIRDTADSHERFFLVEVMGRHAGFIALSVGLCGGAEDILIPETKTRIKDVCRRLCEGRRLGKTSSIVVVAEGDEQGGAYEIAEKLKKLSKIEYRVVVLGHIQRGGSPTAADRLLASELGAFAVHVLMKGKSGVAVGKVSDKVLTVPLASAFSKKKTPPMHLLKLARTLGK